MKKLLIAVLVLVVIGSAAALSLLRSGNDGLEVRGAEVEMRRLVSTVTASGNIRARRTVDISSDVSARVASLEIEEGEDVQVGQVLLRLDPAQLEAAVAQAEAALSQAEAQAANQRANHLRAQRELDRARALQARDSVLVSLQQIEEAETNLDVAYANLEAARYGVQQATASLDEARDRLSKTIIRAPIDGKVTRLSIEEGETAVIGTMNNPGSLLLTISDLSVVEVVVQVDETDVPELSPGDSANVEIDAFPAETFSGRVTEIGNSAVRPPSSAAASGQQVAIDFEVVITLDPTTVALRPDLSATADIVTEIREQAVAVPIIALTVRDPGSIGSGTPERSDDGDDGDQPVDIEGVFAVRGDTVTFVPVELGIAGAEFFEVLSGVSVGDTVVSGPYQLIRQLDNGDAVSVEMGDPDPSGVG